MQHRFGEAVKVELAVRFNEFAEVDRTQVADGGLVLVCDLDDLGAEV